MDQDQQTLEDLRRTFIASFDDMIAFTRQVRRLAELGEDDEPEVLTFHFVVMCIQSRPAHCVPRFIHHREDFARELAHVITSVG